MDINLKVLPYSSILINAANNFGCILLMVVLILDEITSKQVSWYGNLAYILDLFHQG